MSSKRIAEARELIARCEGAWREGNAAEPAAMALADILAGVIRWIEPAVEKESKPVALCDKPSHSVYYDGPCTLEQGHDGACDPLPF